jgi:2-keto-4-pentenoate hydratase/2-oxohepta-3-ene-1,7-dioic acid hydratase in catechol pathway
MRRVRFKEPAGHVRHGEWTDDGIEFGGRTYDPEAVDVLPPVEPTKVICVAANYVEHLRESGRDVPEDLPDRPSVFMKGPNAVVGHGDTVTLPTPGVTADDADDAGSIEIGSGRIDYEAELGVVIGEQCRNVPEGEARSVITGYTCVNDISNRDDQQAEQNWIRGKAFDGAAPMGPVLATPDEVPDDPRIRLYVNGDQRQDSADDEFVFSISEVIADVTRFVTLEEGDVIAMGTTYGVGPLSDGDTVEVEIEGVGTLEHHVSEGVAGTQYRS